MCQPLRYSLVERPPLLRLDRQPRVHDLIFVPISGKTTRAEARVSDVVSGFPAGRLMVITTEKFGNENQFIFDFEVGV